MNIEQSFQNVKYVQYRNLLMKFQFKIKRRLSLIYINSFADFTVLYIKQERRG